MAPEIFWKKPKKPKNRPQGARGGGGVKFFFYPNFYYFFLGAHAKIWNNTTTPSVVLNNGGNTKKRKEKWKKIPKIVATLVCSAGARNTLGPKWRDNLVSLAGRCMLYMTKLRVTHNLSWALGGNWNNKQ